MSGVEVTVVRTGVANVAAVLAALRRAGARASLSDRVSEVRDAGAVVLPGVGAFGPGIERLRDRGLDVALRARVHDGRPLLAVCLGMQMLGDSSDEAPGVAGIAACPSRYERFAGAVRVPQIGWNTIRAADDARIVASGAAYFANSYQLATAPDGWASSWSEHGERFVASLERGAIVLCQFHPELSGAYGAQLIERWLAAARREACSC